MKEFNFGRINNEIRNIYQSIVKEIDKIDNQELVNFLNDFKQTIDNSLNKSKLNIAFVGQYSSGKSSIIKAMTGNQDIKTGQDIVTDDTTSYPWHDVNLVDTPGIYAGRADHDLKALDYINKADLLVYTVTIKGFEDNIGKNFRKLAFEENKIDKMMLVLNKSSLEPISNRDNWLKNPMKVIEPATLKELKTTCIDVEQFLRANLEEDETRRAKRIQKSNFISFIENLNEFIKEKGLLGQLIAPLNIIETFLKNSISILQTSDEYSKKVLELLRRKETIILKTKDKIDLQIMLKLRNMKSDIKTRGFASADKLNFNLDETSLNSIIEEVNQEIEEICDRTTKEIEILWEDSILRMNDQLIQLIESDLYKSLKSEIEAEIDMNIEEYDSASIISGTIDNGKLNPRLKRLPNILTNISRWVDSFTRGTIGGRVLTSSPVSGSTAHQFVKYAGKFFNIKFRPYGAINVVSNLSTAGKALGLASLVLGPVLAAFEEYNETKAKELLMQKKKEVRDNFNITSQQIFDDLKNTKDKKISEIFDIQLDEISKERETLSDKNELYDNEVKIITKILQQVKHLFNEIHSLNNFQEKNI